MSLKPSNPYLTQGRMVLIVPFIIAGTSWWAMGLLLSFSLEVTGKGPTPPDELQAHHMLFPTSLPSGLMRDDGRYPAWGKRNIGFTLTALGSMGSSLSPRA